MYSLSKTRKAYVPKAPHNVRSWKQINRYLSDNGGKATERELQECMHYQDGEQKVEHVGFVSYLIRLGHLVETKK